MELLGQIFKGISQNLLSPNAAIHAFAVAGNVGNVSSVLQRTYSSYNHILPNIQINTTRTAMASV